MHKRVRHMTLTEVSDMCDKTGDDPVVAAGDLLAGHHEGTDVLGLLAPVSAKRSENALNIA